ncbi:MAG: two pore domain potassium channel family protein [gamma proteobacterium symbiont of Bathyaustriella thionipta]|nr:two pore domain potassium channel family protein [gamma proteobacterium symbiont of Bathyaustriella thionipta]
MLTMLLLGSALVFITMSVQLVFVVMMLRYISRIVEQNSAHTRPFRFDVFVLGMVLLILWVGHLLQISIWASLFMMLDEFDHFAMAFYHSAVNFTSLGYGDIVMTEKWRLLGALEAGNGVLMFGLSTGTVFAVMSRLFAQHKSA